MHSRWREEGGSGILVATTSITKIKVRPSFMMNLDLKEFIMRLAPSYTWSTWIHLLHQWIPSPTLKKKNPLPCYFFFFK